MLHAGTTCPQWTTTIRLSVCPSVRLARSDREDRARLGAVDLAGEVRAGVGEVAVEAELGPEVGEHQALHARLGGDPPRFLGGEVAVLGGFLPRRLPEQGRLAEQQVAAGGEVGQRRL